ncbi:MAG TPA: NAD(P)H-hydrate epimerase [Acidimicrobiia bacterium]|nr:NAD(P)H-hydrate epimerase [Acidimicrobiia bacterium]
MKSFSFDELPSVSEAQMRDVDRLMIDDFHISLLQMMENAGRNLAELCVRVFAPASVVVLAGGGGNGGGGLVAARHLFNRGVPVAVALSHHESTMAPVPRQQFDILAAMDVPFLIQPENADLVIDALIGYSLHGDPSGRTAELIKWANAYVGPVLSLDAPSGLDVTTGKPSNPCVSAAATMTIALPKRGLRDARVGDLYLADISVPAALYRQLDLDVPVLFRDDTLVKIS